MSRIGKTTETESKLVVVRGCGGGGSWEWLLMNGTVCCFCGQWKCSGTGQWKWLHKLVNVLKPTELWTLKGWI